jgi:endonuclease III|tara:strand:- start:952 stop:1224 length:273 start_codon:yes stop_codon:yes gene_type:complete
MIMSIKRALVMAKVLAHQNNAALEGIGETISVLFSTLANVDPQQALSVLEQLSSQITQEVVDEQLSNLEEWKEELEDFLNINREDIEEFL